MPMELKEEVNLKSDDEDELEKLRLVALQSLKRAPPVSNSFKKSPPNVKRRNFGRNRNGQFKIRNTNLISIPTIDDSTVNNHKKDCEEIKLILPQDRYSNIKKENDEKTESTSKFDRYDNSDKSESESEYESESGSESESPAKLERANSLEALMQELENEIQGNSQPKTETENKKKVKKRKKKIETEQIKEIEPRESNQVEEIKTEPKNEIENEVKPLINEPQPVFNQKQSPLNRPRRPFGKFERKTRHNQPYHNPFPPQLNYNVQIPYVPPLYNPIQYTPTPIIPQIPPIPPQIPPQVPPIDLQHRTYFDRPLSPLKLNTEDVLTIARAPLSPRSAAFVLQNRDAIERRKKSPRRSYSRSPSPRYHRSKSKSRSRTPLKDERRITPVKEIRKRSPIRRRSPKVKERLGIKKKRSRSISPINPNKIIKTEEKEKDDKLDPILEARKRKFESNEIKNKEGIIRLKPKQEIKSEEVKTDEVKEEVKPPEENIENVEDVEENLDDVINTKVDDIFSDEETDEENEGRFKLSSSNSVNDKKLNARVVPFGKLLDSNDTKRTDRTRPRGRSPLRNRDSKSDNGKIKDKSESRLTTRKVKTERKEKLVPTIENKKIEIKIRNPAKYETTTKYDVKNENKERPTRKVEVTKKSEMEEDEVDEKIDLEIDDDGGFNNQKCDSGDLRAQLSRKRAERQNRLPTVENVPSRLLQSALQSAVFKKQKKVKAENDTAPKEYAAVKRTAKIASVTFVKVKNFKLKSNERKVRFLCTEVGAEIKDGKMPIHLRLGVANVEGGPQKETMKSKKSGKSKGRADQV